MYHMLYKKYIQNIMLRHT